MFIMVHLLKMETRGVVPIITDLTHGHFSINRQSSRTRRYASTSAAILDRLIAGIHIFPRLIHRITAAQIGVSLRVRWVQDTIFIVLFFSHGSVFPSMESRLLCGVLKNEHQAVRLKVGRSGTHRPFGPIGEHVQKAHKATSQRKRRFFNTRLQRDLLVRLRPSGPFTLWKAGSEGVMSPAQAFGVVAFPVGGNPLEKNRLRNCPGVRMLFDEGRETLDGIGEPESVEKHFCLA
jgi:hypothetical protein